MPKRRKRPRATYPDRVFAAMADNLAKRPKGLTDEYWFSVCVLRGVVAAHFGRRQVPAVFDTPVFEAVARLFQNLNGMTRDGRPFLVTKGARRGLR